MTRKNNEMNEMTEMNDMTDMNETTEMTEMNEMKDQTRGPHLVRACEIEMQSSISHEEKIYEHLPACRASE